MVQRFNVVPCVSGCVISIHLMLWFNLCDFLQGIQLIIFQYILCCGSTMSTNTTKDKNSYFNTSYVVVQQHHLKTLQNLKSISIHLMLWFNITVFLWDNISIKRFQYILCCGSTIKNTKTTLSFSNFNTSYVVVQPQLSLYKSILNQHFNTSYVVVQQHM